MSGTRVWHQPTKRTGFTDAQRARVFMQADGVCTLCSRRIRTPAEKWEVEHKERLADGGSNELSNLVPVHVECHRAKSAIEATRGAKEARVRNKHLGIKKTKSAPMPGTKASGWKFKLDGTRERRDAND